MRDARVLVVGGAGFVGSNLILQLLKAEPREIIVVDNLLSSEDCNIPKDLRVRFVLGSITDDAILAALPENLDFAFHLACYHGNQSSIADPIADHDNNNNNENQNENENEHQPPFPRTPVQLNGSFRGLPQKANSCSCIDSTRVQHCGCIMPRQAVQRTQPQPHHADHPNDHLNATGRSCSHRRS